MTADLIRRIEVVATSAVTRILIVIAILTQVATLLPEEWQIYVAQAIAVLTAIVTIIRRVSPVDDPAKYGVLPKVNER